MVCRHVYYQVTLYSVDIMVCTEHSTGRNKGRSNAIYPEQCLNKHRLRYQNVSKVDKYFLISKEATS